MNSCKERLQRCGRFFSCTVCPPVIGAVDADVRACCPALKITGKREEREQCSIKYAGAAH